ncbi:MAG: hypothetical protein ACPGYL_05485 [Rhodospirillaceae bacterium]
MTVTAQLFGILAIALVGLLFYLSIYLFGMWFMLYVGLIGTVVGFVLVLAFTAAKDPEEV